MESFDYWNLHQNPATPALALGAVTFRTAGATIS